MSSKPSYPFKQHTVEPGKRKRLSSLDSFVVVLSVLAISWADKKLKQLSPMSSATHSSNALLVI